MRVPLVDLAEAAHFGTGFGLVQNRREVEALGFPMLDGLPRHQPIGAADHVFELADAEFCHDFAKFLRDEAHEIHDMIRFAGETLAQARILRGDADGAGVQMADPHHDAAGRDEWARGETKFLRTQQRRNRDVSAGFQLPIRFQNDSPAQIIQHQHLLCFRKPQFPRNPGMPNRTDRRSARASIVAADEDYIRMRLGHACGHSSHARFGH